MRLRRLLPLAAAGLAALYVRRVHRFRDPVRVLTAPDSHVVSPADGVVCFVRRVTDGSVQAGPGDTPVAMEALLGTAAGDGWLLGIMVGSLDVHYTYQPVSGKVGTVQHHTGQANSALLNPLASVGLLAGRPANVLATRAMLENERMSVTLHAETGDVTVAVVAPGASLDAMPYLKEGDRARAGYKLAFLPQGGLVLLHLPTHLTP
ncbi:phosphatidylserine decarboxylase, partial [Deinococcus sp.]|uniref:phosphatidylserine decarboxylase n=1 Tax=Deinococcus sp. TaxID=47478 RepID=UPI002869E0E4